MKIILSVQNAQSNENIILEYIYIYIWWGYITCIMYCFCQNHALLDLASKPMFNALIQSSLVLFNLVFALLIFHWHLIRSKMGNKAIIG